MTEITNKKGYFMQRQHPSAHKFCDFFEKGMFLLPNHLLAREDNPMDRIVFIDLNTMEQVAILTLPDVVSISHMTIFNEKYLAMSYESTGGGYLLCIFDIAKA